jgi:nucleolar MIF4G domain-containing protein 1
MAKLRLPKAMQQEIGIQSRRSARRDREQAPRKRRKLYQPLDEEESADVQAPSKARKEERPRTHEEVLMDQDDREIDYWEAKLSRGPTAGDDQDGLDDIFDGLDLPRGESQLEYETESGSAGDIAEFEESQSEDAESTEHNARIEAMAEPLAAPVKAKPSIYEPAVADEGAASTAYIPPALRKAQGNSQLERQLKGHLNRLSAANIATIYAEIEQIYASNPRGQVNSSLATLIQSIVAGKQLDAFIIQYAALIAALYKSHGTEFAASMVQSLVESIDQGKKLLPLLVELYNFNVVSAMLIYDFVREALDSLTEEHVENLLLIVRACGSSLRSDDPSALRNILALLQSKVKETSEISARTQFMIDTLVNLKNNKVTQDSTSVKELRTRLRKFIGNLDSKTGSGPEALRVSLDDIRHVKTRGKWWLVGASWAGDTSTKTSIKAAPAEEPVSQELAELAQAYRLTHPIRKQIFITILSSGDYLEAITSLLSLRLKKSQEAEISRVLVMLVGGEERFNPYYLYIAKGLVDRHGMRISLQFCLWDLFRELGEEEVQIGASGHREEVRMRRIINCAKFYGGLIALGSLPLTILKMLTFSRLQARTKQLLNIMFSEIFLKVDDKALVSVFQRICTTEHKALRDGVDWFLRKQVAKARVVHGADAEKVKAGVELARTLLTSSR